MSSAFNLWSWIKVPLGQPRGVSRGWWGRHLGLRKGLGRGNCQHRERRSPTLWETWVSPEEMEEQAVSIVFLRTSQGAVRNASPLLHLEP